MQEKLQPKQKKTQTLNMTAQGGLTTLHQVITINVIHPIGSLDPKIEITSQLRNTYNQTKEYTSIRFSNLGNTYTFLAGLFNSIIEYNQQRQIPKIASYKAITNLLKQCYTANKEVHGGRLK